MVELVTKKTSCQQGPTRFTRDVGEERQPECASFQIRNHSSSVLFCSGQTGSAV